MDSDLISRSETLKAIKEFKENLILTNSQYSNGMKIGISMGMAKIATMPTVDAVEVVHGEWTGLISEDFVCAEGFNTGMTEKQKGKCLEDFYHRTHCSICNCCFDDRDVKNWNYCPNCGSKMDGGKKDEM